MLKKLINYDLKWMIKIIYIYYILGIIFAVLARLTTLLPDSLFFNIIKGICNGAALSLVITGLVNVAIRSWVRMTINMYKDESYLTHTLPIDTKLHFFSKVISVLILICCSVLVILLTVFILYYSKENITLIKNSLNIISSGLDLSVTTLIILISLVLLTEVLFIVLSGFFGITYGYSYNNRKLGKSLLFGIGIYFICNIISVIVMMIGTVFSSDLYDAIFKGGDVNFRIVTTIMIMAFVLYSVYCALIYFMINKKLDQGVNID